ncbi:ATP-binding cassette domain-containing protein [Sneathiella sp. P13V-1]|uniref:ABC transporter ATP-binding protein n=1 Tax=Sneathiella sp. P13V-1 TaxID=2697366 RepID=UPI00187B9610|nr:ABC transporter ATP-binding protein [Sneathiella sp. P13V-1]MBE7638160.1 ATP-binding cassette domain-containing protein [Sneathiella sp. P13V-1]
MDNVGGVTPRLSLAGITKAYPGVLANDDIHLNILPGEIHALLGENGAGKSTLVKIIYGVLKADSGTIAWEGKQMEIASPQAARKLGIGMIFQHFSLFEAMTVTENIALGMPGRQNMAALAKRIVEVSEKYGLPLQPDRHVHTLSVGEKQRIEIVRCLLQDPKLLIMDEPTSVLTPQEAETMFKTLRRLAEEGVSILYISHKLDEIKALCHKATILRGGRYIAECDPTQETAKSLAEMMIGTNLTPPRHTDNDKRGAIKLKAHNMSLDTDDQFGVDLNLINFELRRGEILGIAGVAGNGQVELLQALSGERTLPNGDELLLDGQAIGHLGPVDRRNKKISFVPEDRLGHGSVPDMSLVDNAFLSAYRTKGLLSSGLINTPKTTRFAEDIVKAFDVRTAGVDHTAGSLSGGNLQKFIVGREMMQDPELIIIAHPTWGVDAGAAAAIHQAIIDLADNGAAVLVVSQDLDELFAISNRIAVIAEGRLSASRDIDEITIEEIGLLMGGTTSTDASAQEGATVA